MFIGGCLGYEYYVRPVLAGKGGWANVDADPAPAAASAARSGAEVYEAACASCHGPDRAGMPRTFVGFETAGDPRPARRRGGSGRRRSGRRTPSRCG
ncbi:MAG TPA: c-type cytochrome [Polyangia bacterium]|jgi:mono/diheme cytochrome c family protein